MLDSPREVVRCLITYTDWCQPHTGSIMKVGAARLDKSIGDGLNPGIIETIDERAELCRRTALLSDKERLALFLFYVRQLHIDDIADHLGVSRRQFFRIKARAVASIIRIGNIQGAA